MLGDLCAWNINLGSQSYCICLSATFPNLLLLTYIKSYCVFEPGLGRNARKLNKTHLTTTAFCASASLLLFTQYSCSLSFRSTSVYIFYQRLHILRMIYSGSSWQPRLPASLLLQLEESRSPTVTGLAQSPSGRSEGNEMMASNTSRH